VEVKELIAQEETAAQHNTELLAKLEEEKKKFEGLLDEKMDIDERFTLANKAYEETKERLHQQQEVLDKLKAQIEG